MTDIYFSYDRDTGEFVGQVQRHPRHLSGPAHSTTIAPPAAPTGMAPVFEDGAWALIEDHRGSTLWNDQGAFFEMPSLGPIPEGWSLEKPAPALAELKKAAQAKVVALADQLSAQILSKYPVAERAAWESKLADARSILAEQALGRPISAALVNAGVFRHLATELGLDDAQIVERAQSVVDYAENFAAISATTEAMRVKAEPVIEAAETAAELDASLQALKQEALGKAQALGIDVSDFIKAQVSNDHP